jgi:putative ATP-dependent endonuclease of the OLD family
VGELAPRLPNSETHLEFEHIDKPSTRLHDMGGGVEQLLMIATVLETTPTNAPIFLEEPESHLHPGTQRYLFDQLINSGRQVFITTHSSVFLGDTRNTDKISVYHVSQQNRRTNITRISGTGLKNALRDIGVSHTDSLLCDALVFVENDYDADVLKAMSRTLRMPLEERNIGFVPLGGATSVGVSGRVSAEALKRINQNADSIPHLFVIDRDERTQDEIERLNTKDMLGSRLRVLQRREMENYVLKPKALEKYIKTYSKSNDPIMQAKRDSVTINELGKLIEKTRDGLKSHTFAKIVLGRIHIEHRTFIVQRNEFETMKEILENSSTGEELAQRIKDQLILQARIDDVPALVEKEKVNFDLEWGNLGKREAIVPGEEILATVLSTFGISAKGSELKKKVPKIAAYLDEDEIETELRTLIDEIYRLPTQWNK